MQELLEQESASIPSTGQRAREGETRHELRTTPTISTIGLASGMHHRR
jgi:hypothetical protein